MLAEAIRVETGLGRMVIAYSVRRARISRDIRDNRKP
jgi:hypothetical protein